LLMVRYDRLGYPFLEPPTDQAIFVSTDMEHLRWAGGLSIMKFRKEGPNGGVPTHNEGHLTNKKHYLSNQSRSPMNYEMVDR
jgi:hypothetical protein